MHENGLGQFIENRIHSNNFAGKIYRLANNTNTNYYVEFCLQVSG